MFSGIGGNEELELLLLSASPRLLEDGCDLRCDSATSSITSSSFLYYVIKTNVSELKKEKEKTVLDVS